jgi:hypothetical protein
MTVLPRLTVRWVLLGVLAAAVAGCATARNPLTSTTEFDSMVPGWQSRFSLEWKSEPAQGGTVRLYGRVVSHYGRHASRFRVLGMAVDSSGKVIGQRVEWVQGGVPGFSQAYFEIDHLVAAASYRVTVWDYSFVEARGNQQ